ALPIFDSNKLSVLAWAQVVDDLGKGLFAASTFACNKHRHVRRRHLHGYPNRVVQQRRVADNAEPKLYTLYVSICNCHSQTAFPISVAPVQSSTRTSTYSPLTKFFLGNTTTLFAEFLPWRNASERFDGPSTSTVNVLPTSARFRSRP